MTRPAKPQAWTAEPWSWEPYDGEGPSVKAGPYFVAVATGHAPVGTQEEACGDTGDASQANAARIVSCVNAMAGIPDPAAYRAAVKRLLAAIDDAGWLGHAIREAEFALLDIEDPSEENSDG